MDEFPQHKWAYTADGGTVICTLNFAQKTRPLWKSGTAISNKCAWITLQLRWFNTFDPLCLFPLSAKCVISPINKLQSLNPRERPRHCTGTLKPKARFSHFYYILLTLFSFPDNCHIFREYLWRNEVYVKSVWEKENSLLLNSLLLPGLL